MSSSQKTALVLGGGGFIGNAMVERLKKENYWVRSVDLKAPSFNETKADDFIIGDLRNIDFVNQILKINKNNNNTFDEIYQFAADMGGAGYIFTGENDADILNNSCLINLNLLDKLKSLKDVVKKIPRIFYSSSACIYPAEIQENVHNPGLKETDAYPANPDSEYGWEKLFSEHLYRAYSKNYGFEVRIARYHNIYGPRGTWYGGKEKSPAAICRKVGLLPSEGGEIEVWGDGLQTRSFLYIDECIEASRRLMKSDVTDVLNIGSEEMVSINKLVDIVAKISKKNVTKKYIKNAPVGVRGRNSQNDLIKLKLQWNYSLSLEEGILKTYKWILEQILKMDNKKLFLS